MLFVIFILLVFYYAQIVRTGNDVLDIKDFLKISLNYMSLRLKYMRTCPGQVAQLIRASSW